MKITPKEGSGTFILTVSDNDDCHSTAQYSIVKFTPELLEQIKLFKEIIEGLKAQGKSVYRMTAFEYSVKYFSECSYDGIENIDDDVADALYKSMKHNTEGLLEVKPIDTEGIPMLRTECDQLIVDDFGVMFDAYVKHTETRMWTAKISFEQLGL
jgi:hypothetical protein